MGRIKTKKIKSVTKNIMARFEDSLTDNFDKNKKVVDSVSTIQSKKIRNVIAGYCTRLMKMKAKQAL